MNHEITSPDRLPNGKRRRIIVGIAALAGLYATPAAAVSRRLSPASENYDAAPPCLSSSALRTLSEIELIHTALRELSETELINAGGDLPKHIDCDKLCPQGCKRFGNHPFLKLRRQDIRVLALQPGIGRPVEDMPEAFRECLIDFGENGYVARYYIEGDTVTVLAVWRQKEAGI
jgi:hypothetical protein